MATTALFLLVSLLPAVCVAALHADSGDDRRVRQHSSTPLDDAMRRVVFPELGAAPAFRDRYYIAESAVGHTNPQSGIIQEITKINGWQSLEDTVFAQRPNALSYTLRVLNDGDFRVSYGAVSMGCYFTRASEGPLVNDNSQWSGLPRPVALASMEVDGKFAFRTWASEDELSNKQQPGLSWCMSPAIEDASAIGVSREFISIESFDGQSDVTIKARTGARRTDGDQKATIDFLRDMYETSLTQKWKEADISIQYVAVNVSIAGDADDWTKYRAIDYSEDVDVDADVAQVKKLRTTLENGRERVLQANRNYLYNDRLSPRRVAVLQRNDVVLSVCSAVAGTMMEHFFLSHLLEGRETMHTYLSMSWYIRAGVYTLVLLLGCADLLPLVFIVIQERQRETWKGRGMEAAALTAHATGQFLNGTPVDPVGYAIGVVLEVWQVDSIEPSRLWWTTTLLAIGTVMHLWLVWYFVRWERSLYLRKRQDAMQ